MLLDAIKNFLGIYETPNPVEGDASLVLEVKENKISELREMTEQYIKENGG